MNALLLYCRPGFEGDCAAEVQHMAAEQGVYGFAKTKKNTGLVLFQCQVPEEADYLARKLPFNRLVFARQMLVVSAYLEDLDPQDRISPMLEIVEGMPLPGQLRVETADTNEAKELSSFCKKFLVPLRQKLRKAAVLTEKETDKRPVLHVCFTDSTAAYLGYSYSYNNSPLPMGIRRLKFPSEAPSRSTLKLEEAFLTFVPEEERESRLTSGLNAVDLGACPGGWTYQLVRRGMMVQAIDNGAMAESLMETGQVKHYREDGFKFVPKKKNIHWLVCDMIEKPQRVAKLMVGWVIEGYCKEAIFNLKLPMSKRFQSMLEVFEQMDETFRDAGRRYEMQAKHLYHDREEITVHLRLK